MKKSFITIICLGLIACSQSEWIDLSFGEDGIVRTDITNANDYFSDFVIQDDGKIIATGTSGAGAGDNDLLLIRYNANGSIDGSFGFNGFVSTPIAYSDRIVLQDELPIIFGIIRPINI